MLWVQAAGAVPEPSNCPAQFRIVHLTDLHLAQAPCNGTGCSLDRFEQAVRRINALQPLPAFVVITGDIAEAEGASEIYSRFTETAQRLRVLFEVLPGNHDDPALLDAAIGRSPPAYRSFTYCGTRFLLLDSNVRGALSGAIDPEQSSWIRSELERDPGKPTLVFLHHHLLPVGSDPQYPLAHGREFLKFLATFPGVRATASGHVHRSSLVHWGAIAVVTTAALTSSLPPPGYRIFEISNTGTISTVEMNFD